MRITLIVTPKFLEGAVKLSNNEKIQLVNKLDQLSKKPNHSSLRTKSFRKKDGVFESSVNMSIRVLWYYRGADIVLTNVGTHDELERL